MSTKKQVNEELQASYLQASQPGYDFGAILTALLQIKYAETKGQIQDQALWQQRKAELSTWLIADEKHFATNLMLAMLNCGFSGEMVYILHVLSDLTPRLQEARYRHFFEQFLLFMTNPVWLDRESYAMSLLYDWIKEDEEAFCNRFTSLVMQDSVKALAIQVWKRFYFAIHVMEKPEYKEYLQVFIEILADIEPKE